VKVLIIADVHGNLEALKAVLADPHHAVSSGTTWRVALSSAPEALVNHGMAMLARPTGSSRWQFQLLPGCIRVERTVAALERSGAEPAAAAVLTTPHWSAVAFPDSSGTSQWQTSGRRFRVLYPRGLQRQLRGVG